MGSIPTLYVDMAERLAKDAHVTAVCASSTREPGVGVSFLDVEPVVCSSSRLGYALECWSFARRAGKITAALRDRFDVVHCEGFASTWADLVTVHAVRAAEVDHYFTAIEPRATIRRHVSPRVFQPQTAVVLSIERSLLSRTQPLVICPSERVRADVTDYHGIPRENVTVIPYGIEVSKFASAVAGARKRRREMATPEHRLVLLMIASDFRRKGVGRAIELLARARADAELWVIGGDDPGPYVAAAVAAGVGDRVRFVGARSRDELPDWYGASDVFLAPSEQDSWAIPVIEAMAAGCPVIASRFAGSSEAVEQYGAGFVVDGAGDPKEMAQIVDSHLSDPHVRAATSDRARRAAPAFDSEALYPRHLEAHHRASEAGIARRERLREDARAHATPATVQ